MLKPIEDQVVAQARLLIMLLGSATPEGDALELKGAQAEIAEQLLQGLEGLHRAVIELDGGGRSVDTLWYAKLVQRVRERVPAVLPPGSVVAVITRGDPALVDLPGLTAWHFPQAESGAWAGHHPANSQDALDRLDALRRRGARYLLIPSPSSWWLDYYTDLGGWLRSTGELVESNEDLALYRMAEQASPPVSRQEVVYRAHVASFLELAELVLAPASLVAVVTRGDPAWLALRNRRACHFPSSDDGTYMGHPADDEDADHALARAVARGVSYLAIPASLRWWEDAYPHFCRRLRQRYRCIADQAEVGVVFELPPNGDG